MATLPPELPPNVYIRTISAVSCILAAAMIAAVLWLHLLSATIAGFLVYALARELEACLRRHRTLSQRAEATTVIRALVIAALILAALDIGTGRLIRHGHRLEDMLTCIADVLDNLRESLSAVVASYIPQSVTELRMQLVQTTKKYGHQTSALGIDELRASALALVRLILGAMVARSETPDSEHHKPLATALASWLGRLTGTFEAMVFTQAKISALNTTLAAIYLLGTLPLFGQRVPYSKPLILLTFVTGLIPVASDLISSTAIIVISVAASLESTVASLIFLVVVHKLRHFVNARITGNRIDVRAWELILALIVMEVLLSVGGVIAASVPYAYIKRELANAGLVG